MGAARKIKLQKKIAAPKKKSASMERSKKSSPAKRPVAKQAPSKKPQPTKIATKKLPAKQIIKEESRPKTPSVESLILTHRDNGRKLARSILRRWRVVMPLEEVDSTVDLALCEAAARYRIEKGASFITFLFYHLRGHLVRAVASATQETSTFLALAQSAGVDTADWASLEQSDGALVLPDISQELEKEQDTPEAMILKKERMEICGAACENLDSLEKEIVDRSYVQDEPLVDIARSLGYSRCHISRVKKRALERIRQYLVDKSLLDAAELAKALAFDEEEGTMSERTPRRKRRRRIALAASTESRDKDLFAGRVAA